MKKINRCKRRRRVQKSPGFIWEIFLIALVGSLFFYITGESVEENGRIGEVYFSVTEPLGDKLYTDGSTIQVEPGQRVTKDPTLILGKNSKSAYIRARIFFSGLDALLRRQLEEGVALKSGWIYNPMDGYYYYQYPVNAGEKICFFDSLTVPESWDQKQGKIHFCLEVRMEAAEIGCIKIIYDTQQNMCGWTKISS